jgi:hypothetical protein
VLEALMSDEWNSSSFSGVASEKALTKVIRALGVRPRPEPKGLGSGTLIVTCA